MKTYKRKEAIALKYDQNINNAPVVTAKGKGLLAEQIIETAKLHQVPIHEDAALLELLSKMKININEEIPEELFMAVAEVFAFIYQLDKKASEN